MDFDERVSAVGSNMYLPGSYGTYYVSGTELASLPPFLPQSPPSCPVTYSYSDLAFRDYGIDTSAKWHPRGPLTHCLSAEETHAAHRDCLAGSGTLGEVFAKNSPVVFNHHPAPGHGHTHAHSHPQTHSHTSASIYGSVGRNGVLPQAFDQFFETAYGGTSSDSTGTQLEHPATERLASKPPPAAEPGSVDTCHRDMEEKERQREEENSSPESSSGNTEENKYSNGSTYTRSAHAPALPDSCAAVKDFISAFISTRGLWWSRRSAPTKLSYKRARD